MQFSLTQTKCETHTSQQLVILNTSEKKVACLPTHRVYYSEKRQQGAFFTVVLKGFSAAFKNCSVTKVICMIGLNVHSGLDEGQTTVTGKQKEKEVSVSDAIVEDK